LKKSDFGRYINCALLSADGGVKGCTTIDFNVAFEQFFNALSFLPFKHKKRRALHAKEIIVVFPHEGII